MGYSSVCSIKAIGMGVVIITWEFQRLKNVLAMKDAVDAVVECEYTDSSLYVRTTRPLGSQRLHPGHSLILCIWPRYDVPQWVSLAVLLSISQSRLPTFEHDRTFTFAISFDLTAIWLFCFEYTSSSAQSLFLERPCLTSLAVSPTLIESYVSHLYNHSPLYSNMSYND